jgi:hypothetical protein
MDSEWMKRCDLEEKMSAERMEGEFQDRYSLYISRFMKARIRMSIM